MAKITWITPAGNLGTFPESAEFSLQLEANGPLASPGTLGFDPRTSLVGNGRSGEVSAFMPDTKNRWNIKGQNLPGLVRTGQFPSNDNPNYVAPLRLDLEWPYRGGLRRGEATPQPSGGIIGISAVGLVFFGPSAAQQISGLVSGSQFTLNAVEAGIFGEDQFGGHPAPRNSAVPGPGVYHYHDSSFINNNAWEMVPGWDGYRSSNGHSRILGWALDGYPIYGPYGYRNASDATSEIALMKSGYTLAQRDIRRPPDVVVEVSATAMRTSTIRVKGVVTIGMRLDGVETQSWSKGSVRVVQILEDGSLRLNRIVSVKAKDKLQASYPMGVFMEDWEYSSPLGVNLDRHNGRYCVTPEYPNGTYAYFMTQDSSGQPAFPYIIGPSFYGSPRIDNDVAVANLIPPDQLALTFTVVSGSLPPGIQLTPQGLLYGYPTVTDPGSSVARMYDFTIRARDGVNNIADRSFSIAINNIIPPRIVAPVIDSNNSFGFYFNSDYIGLQLSAVEVNPNAQLSWSIPRGQLPPGLSLDNTGLISGFALATAAPGPLGSSAFDVGRYDQFVFDFEGSTLSKTYKFTVRLYDGINFVDEDFSVIIYNKQYFRCDNTIITVDTELFTADRDGFEYPAITTKVRELPVARQNQYYAFKFDAYYFNPNTPVRWRLGNSGPALFDQDNPTIGFDNKGFDQTNLSLPSGITLDPTTGWLWGTLGDNSAYEQDYEFEVIAYVDLGNSIRSSQPVTFKLKVLQSIADLITWQTSTDLGSIENGCVSSLSVVANTKFGDSLSYRIISGQYLRMPQGLQLSESGDLIGRTSFDYFSMDGYGHPITFDQKTQTYDATYSFVVQAYNANVITTAANSTTGTTITTSYANATVYSEKLFRLTVKNVNTSPHVDLYLKALLPADLRSVFSSIVNDPTLVTSEIVYRPTDPNFGLPPDLRILAVPGIKAQSAAVYISNMQDYHYDKQVNLGNIKKAVARNLDGSVKYEVLYVEVFDYNKKHESGNQLPITQPVANTVVRGTSGLTPSIIYPYYGANALSSMLTTVTNLSIYSNSFSNMINELVAGIGLQNQGALPEWMTSIQPDSGQPLGFIHALVIAYANPGQGDKLLYRYKSSLEKSGYGVSDIMRTFSFVADRYQIDQTAIGNFDTATDRFKTSKETSFDKIPSTGFVNQGAWNNRSITGLGLLDLNSVAYAPGYGYLAVGQQSTILSSGTGQSWNTQSRLVDLTYSVSSPYSYSVGTTSFEFDFFPSFRLNDEVVRDGIFNAGTHSYITLLRQKLVLSDVLSDNIPSGTTLIFSDPATGNATRSANVTVNATSGSSVIYMDSVYGDPIINRGDPVSVAGLANLSANVTTVAGNLITLMYPTTNTIASGTHITFNDQAGNVITLTTANITQSGANTIRFTAVTGNLATHGNNSSYVPTITAIPFGTTVLGKFSNITVSTASTAYIPSGAQLTFTGRLSQDQAIGDTQFTITNGTKLSTGLGIFGTSASSFTDAAASWSSAVSATHITASVVSSAINGSIFIGMKVIGAGLPADAYISDIETSAGGSITYITISWDLPINVDSTVDSVLTFIASPVVVDNTVITGITYDAYNNAIVNINTALQGNVPANGDRLLQIGLPPVNINSVSFLDGRWVAVAAGGRVLDRMPTTSSWNSRNALVYGDLYDITTDGNGRWVAVGNESIIVYSDDLENWSAPVFVSGSSSTLRSVAYAEGQWVAVGDNGEILVSPDAVSWSRVGTTSFNLRRVRYLGQWLAVGEQGSVLYSTDATTWNRYSAGTSNTINDINFVNNIYYVCGTQGFIASSSDISAWTVQNASTTSNLLSFACPAPQPVIVGADGTILVESQEFVVDWAMRGIAFDEINWHSVDYLASRGYRVSDGDLIIFAQQENFDRPNDGWNMFSSPYGGTFDAVNYDISTPIPGYYDSLSSPLIPNQRAGVWQINIVDNTITLSFQRQVNVNQTVVIKNESVKLFLDPNIKAGKTVPAYSPVTPTTALNLGKTTFDGQGTRFANNRDTYVEPGTLDKYIKFPKTGVFR